MKREFELVELEKARGRKFGFNLTKYEFEHLLSSDNIWPRVLNHRYEDNSVFQKGLKYYIRYGAPIDDKIIGVFAGKRIRYIPIIVNNNASLVHNRLSNFSKEHSKILMGNIFSCVRKWLSSTGNFFINRTQQSLFEEKTQIENSISKAAEELSDFVTHLIEEVLSFVPNLSVLSLYNELIEDINSYFDEGENSEEYDRFIRHTLEVVTCAVILGKECGLDKDRLKNLALASFLHDIGMIIAYENCRKAFIDKTMSMWNFDREIKKYTSLHPVYGAMLLSDSTGEPVRGLSVAVRQAILQHEQSINGIGPFNFLDDTDADCERIGVDRTAIFLGYNKLPSDAVSEDQYELVDSKIDLRSRKIYRLSLTAQILHIIERYITYKENTGITIALQKMLPYVGDRYNGPVFEKFVNRLVPLEAFPDGTVLKLKMMYENNISNLNGHSILILTKKNTKYYILIKDEKGNFITPRVIEKEKLQNDSVQFVLGKWDK